LIKEEKNVIRKFERKLRTQLFFDAGDYRQTVIVAGTGRSGTTWVEEVINSRNDYRIMFEPFHSKKVDLLRDWNFRQYLRSNDRRDKFLMPATRILSGRVRNEWIDKYNQKFFSNKRLIKDIRAQLLLHWIKHNFPEIPIILLLRHPCAVANSKLHLNWVTHLDEFLRQDELMEDFLSPFRKEIENAEAPFDKHIFMWCVENYIPLKQFKENEILVIFYEDFCKNPRNEIEKVMQFVGSTFTPEMLEKVTKPSVQSHKESAIVSKTDLVSSWRKSISEEQIKRSVEILSLFGLQKIYNQSDFPLLDGTQAKKVFSS
jgi:hypothetical protein